MGSKCSVPGMTQDQARKVADLLQKQLSTYNDLHLTLKHVHWNVLGPNFIGVHEMIDPQVELVHGYADEIAERIATLGFSPQGPPEITPNAYTPASTVRPNASRPRERRFGLTCSRPGQPRKPLRRNHRRPTRRCRRTRPPAGAPSLEPSSESPRRRPVSSIRRMHGDRPEKHGLSLNRAEKVT